MDNSPLDFFAKRKQPVTLDTHSNADYRCIRSGCLCRGVQKRWCYVETFNNIRNMIFSHYLVTKLIELDLNKRHRYSNWCTTISMILCSIRCIISCNLSSWEMRVVYIKMKFNFTDTFWTFWKLNCNALYFKLFSHVSIMCLCFNSVSVNSGSAKSQDFRQPFFERCA
jgi:hypothetical protein